MKMHFGFVLSLFSIERDRDYWCGRILFIYIDHFDWCGSLLEIGRADGRFEYNFFWYFGK